MIILGIETTGPGGGVAVLRDGETVGQRDLARGLMHGRNLVPALGEALAEAGLTPADLDLIAVNRGPGSHTGLRIGLVAAKAMAWSLGKPLAGIDAVDALTAQVPPAEREAAPPGGRAVVPAIDARLGRIYGGVRVGDKWLLPPARHDAATLLAAAPDGAVVLGSGAEALAEMLAERPDLTTAPAGCHDIRAETVARLAAATPELGGDPHAIEAVYFA